MPSSPAEHPYALSSDLAKLCLPAATKDANRKLAYVNSICFMFLVVGLIGLKMPKPYVRPLPEVVDIVPVVFTPPEQPQTVQQDAPQDQPEEVTDAPLDAPVVATVVAADASAVKFAVPVSGPVILAPAQFAAAPPPQTKAPPPSQPVRFVPTGKEEGSFPQPEYPRQALQQRQEGIVTLHVLVGPDRAATSVTVKDSSGYPLLDRAAMAVVRDRWRFPPGITNAYCPIIFRMTR